MKPSYTTIITPIVAERVDALRQYLREHAEPRAGGAGSLVDCRPLFRFDRIKSLHFCSFIILDGDEEFEPYLVFEATFDGPRSDFLGELWRVAGIGMHAVYEHCLGYPRSGLDVPGLIEEYLARHDVGAHTFFSGCPGRSVAQIEGERRLRDDVVTFLAGRRGADDPTPATSAGLQQAMRRDFVRGRCENRWAEGPAVMPWEMTNRDWVARTFGLALLLAACALGAGIIRWRWGMGPAAVRDWIAHFHTFLDQVGMNMADAASPAWSWIGRLVGEMKLPSLYVVVALAALWGVVRVAELILRSVTENPRAQSFALRLPLQIAVILKYAVPVFVIGLAALQFTPPRGHPETGRFDTPSQVKVFVEQLDQKFTMARARDGSKLEDPGPAVFASLVLLAAVGLAWALLSYCATSLKLNVQFQELSPAAENWRLFLLDVLNFARIVAGVTAAAIIARHIPDVLAQPLAAHARPLIYALLVIAAYIVFGILAFYVIGVALFFVVWIHELADLARFKSAADLNTQPLYNEPKYAREEGGINRHQNHLASLTYVKPGLMRRWFLRTTLFVVNLLSQYWFNRGDLGGIPTILSARWVMFDGGRRLLFLDNYTGAWESYLNEFIDMGAVKGLNAIWTNTFVKTAEGREHAWPATKLYFWHGAQAERPFKAYVRQSQIETLVWYGAYPTLSITNINANTELRQSLFQPLAACDLDSVIQHL